MADDRTRPDWWPQWVPIRCGNGHPLLPGRITKSWVHCTCAGAGDAHGHHVWYCSCHWSVWPSEHIGEETPEPPRT